VVEFKRADRVAGLLQQEISIIVQTEIRDPRVKMATITGVKMSDDLKNAKVYFVCDTKKQKKTKEGLERSAGYIKKQLSSRLTLRYMPKISFFYDTSLDYSCKIEGLLREAKVIEDDK